MYELLLTAAVGLKPDISALDDNLVINSGEMVCQMAIEGLGIAYLPDFFVDTALMDGCLIEVLSDYTQESYPISLVYPHNRHMNLALRTFIEELVGKLS